MLTSKSFLLYVHTKKRWKFMQILYYTYISTILGSPRLTFFIDLKKNDSKISKVKCYILDIDAKYIEMEEWWLRNIKANPLPELPKFLRKVSEFRNSKLMKPPDDYKFVDKYVDNANTANFVDYIYKNYDDTIKTISTFTDTIKLNIPNVFWDGEINVYKAKLTEELTDELNVLYDEYLSSSGSLKRGDKCVIL